MHTYIKRIWQTPSDRLLMGLASFAVGSFAGFMLASPPTVPLSCPSAHLQAHFLERDIAFEHSKWRLPSSSAAPLRGAAPAALAERPVALLEASSVSSVPSVPSVSSTVSSTASIDVPSSDSSVSSAESASSSASSEASSSVSSIADAFPAFDRAVFPVARTPDWGAMKTPAEWERSYGDMEREDFVRIPAYDLDALTTPMKELLKNRSDPDTIAILTAKLFYSTRFFGTYDLDAGEFTGDHAGIDLKVPEGTPVGAIAGGRVAAVTRESSGLGLHVVVEHRLDGETFYSIYGHLDAVSVREGQDVAPGERIGLSGSTGRSTAPHLHLQVDRGEPGQRHDVYWPNAIPSRAEAARHTLNPASFIEAHAR